MRAAIIGFGRMGQRHFKAYEILGIPVVAVCDLDREKVSRLFPQLPREMIFSHPEELLQKAGPLDIVSVVTNGPTHANITLMAAETGVANILCEKPIATHLGDAERIVFMMRKRGTRVAINHIRRFSLSHRKLKQLIANGVIGDLRHIYVQCGSTGLGNMGTHFFDMMRYYTEKDASWITASIDRTGTPNPRGDQFSDPGGFGLVQFTNGVRGFLDASEDTGVPFIFHFAGSHGRVLINELADEWKIFIRKKEDWDLPLTRYGTILDEYPFELECPFDIVDLTKTAITELLDGSSIASTLEDGLKSLEMVVACHISDEMNGKRIFFPLSKEFHQREISIA